MINCDHLLCRNANKNNNKKFIVKKGTKRSSSLSLSLSVCVFVCVYKRERERVKDEYKYIYEREGEREREWEWMIDNECKGEKNNNK